LDDYPNKPRTMPEEQAQLWYDVLGYLTTTKPMRNAVWNIVSKSWLKVYELGVSHIREQQMDVARYE